MLTIIAFFFRYHDKHNYVLLVAMAIMGGYTGLYMLFKMKSAMSKKEPEKVVAAPSSAPSGGVPSIDSPEFGEWLGSDAFNAFIEKA